MKLLSIDIETTGLDTDRCGILEVGAVLFEPKVTLEKGIRVDSRWQFFECLVDNHTIQGEPYALAMNHEILAEISGQKETHRPLVKAGQIAIRLANWLREHGVTAEEKVTVVGKNYASFDEKFLEKLSGWNSLIKPLCERRTLDVGSLFFTPEDGKVVGLEECLKRVGTAGLVTHRALDDACAVATAISRLYN